MGFFIIVILIIAVIVVVVKKSGSSNKSNEALNKSAYQPPVNNKAQTIEDELRAKINAGEKCYVKYQALIEQAINGNPEAQWDLGTCYLFDSIDDFPKDLSKATYWLTKSYEQGNTKAAYDLGQIYYLKYNNRDYGTKLITEAAQKKLPAAQRWLAISYLYGLEHEKNIELGISLLEEAASKNDAIALETLGNKYRIGAFVEKDLVKAEELLRKAASRDMKDACLRLGELLWEKHNHLNSEDMFQDIKFLITSKRIDQIKEISLDFNSDWGKEAFNCFSKSLALGPSEDFGAEYYLGLCYKFGLGVDQNPELGRKYLMDAYNIAIQSDHPAVQYIESALNCNQ